MAYCLDAEKILLVLNPRTASSALSSHLGKTFGGRWLPEQDLLDDRGNIQVQRKHSTVPELLAARLMSEDDLDRYRKIVAVRNPFDSLVSLWVKKRHAYAMEAADPDFFGHKIPGFMEDMAFIQQHTFSEWVVEKYAVALRPDARNSLHRKFVAGCDHILRFETLQEDFQALMKKLGLSAGDIPELNKTASKGKDWRAYYSPEARDIIQRRFAHELARYGYTFDQTPAKPSYSRQ